jgi:hypothetical protein
MRQRRRLEQSALAGEIQQALNWYFSTDVRMVRRVREEIIISAYVEKNAKGGQIVFSYTP